ncbi:NlpC/P60 family protein [Bacillus sp. OV322]|uniref:C40 family peptidase n=1 Tax=Bacillus sp. OV322 TaxID=1882764 RepID=UPI0008E2F09E|nr:C40 family peptidase [Bacillus sp. OV322]SFC64693.1 NlpC/P60 family protein [Bacillus sp. OV322]
MRVFKKITTIFITVFIFFFAFSMVPGLSQSAKASPSPGQEAAATAGLYNGKPFKWGGTTPNGFDASGFTQYVFSHSYAKLKLPRTVKEQYKMGSPVQKKTLKEGDLVFFKIDGKNVSFVGIFLGQDQFIAAASKGVSIQSLSLKYYSERYAGAKRIVK